MKEKIPVEKRIVAKALEMFNETGIEYVGMRELAAALDMRIGNLTYYFPTKDHLVERLAIELAEENNQTIVEKTTITVAEFFEMLHQVFRNHSKYRCLLLSFVHIMQNNPLIANRYSKTQTRRNEIWATNTKALVDGNWIRATPEEADFLVSTLALIARFWISEAVISFKKEPAEDQMLHYVRMVARIFLPYATAKGRRQLTQLLDRPA